MLTHTDMLFIQLIALGFAAFLLITFAIAWLYQKAAEQFHRTCYAQLYDLVAAAEQRFGPHATGDTKGNFVMTEIARRHPHTNLDYLRWLMESALYHLRQQQPIILQSSLGFDDQDIYQSSPSPPSVP